jgi:heme exporter protein B
MQTELLTYLNEAKTIWLHDLQSELRTRYALNAIFMFAFTSLVAVSFAIGPFRIAEADKPFLNAVLLWLVLLFSALSGLARSFVKEEEAHTMDILKISASPPAVFLGKFGFNLTLLLILEIFIVPLFIILMGHKINHVLYFINLIFWGGCALSASTTLVAAMITRARVKGALFSALSFPLLFPLLIVAIKGSEKASLGLSVAGWYELKIILAYFVIMMTVSLMLFPVVWEE